jgi:hypothetical protein
MLQSFNEAESSGAQQAEAGMMIERRLEIVIRQRGQGKSSGTWIGDRSSEIKKALRVGSAFRDSFVHK